MEVKGKVNRKTQLTQAAERLFSEKGYLATSMRDLADALDMEAASLYTYISSKDELLFNIADRCANDFFAAVEPIFKSNLNTEAKLTGMIVAHMEVIARNLQASAVFFSEWRHLAEPRKSDYAQRRDDYEKIFRSVVKKGIEENLFYHYDEGFTTRTILSALNWTHTWFRPDGELKPEEIGERLARILLTGLIRNM